MGDDLNITTGPKPAVGGTATTLGAEAMEFDKSDEEKSNDIADEVPGTNEDAGGDNFEATGASTGASSGLDPILSVDDIDLD